MQTDEQTEYERGLKDGRTAQTLAQHTENIARINGSVAATAAALTKLAAEFEKMRVDMRVRDELARTSRSRRERRLGWGIGIAAVVVSVVAVLANFATAG